MLKTRSPKVRVSSKLPRYGGAFFDTAGVSSTSGGRQNPMKVFCD
jgi:hypothetical protein